MTSNRWFHNISGVNAEKLLTEKGLSGSFLARPSYSSPGSFTLSVRRGNEVTHIKIQNTDDFLDLFGGEKFATLPELVAYYMQEGKELKEKNGQIIELKHPLHSVDPTTERWFHGDITGKEAERLLLEKGKNGSFLVRESMRHPGYYVVSVLTGDHVDHVMIHRKPEDKFDIGGGRQFETLKDLIDFYVTTPMVEKSGTLVSLIHPLNATRVNVLTIKERMNQLEKNNSRCPQGFLEEFDELQQDARNKNLTRDEGFKPCNSDKNRYRNILPFDNTRVILTDGDANALGSDYINANFIVWPYENNENSSEHLMDCNSPKLKYVATQGTLENTVVDFWRMVWQERSIVIAMITKEVEKGKNKCVPYWPTKERKELIFKTFKGQMIVKYISEQDTETFILREMLLINVDRNGNQESFNVYQYHFMVWPDHGTPKDPSTLLGFMEQCNDRQMSVLNAGPMVVHCSAGIGRSGTFIAIDILINQIKGDLNKEIDILRTVQIIRDQRSGMVQTETQYRFVYQAVREFVQLEKNRQNIFNDVKKSGRDYTNLKRFPDLIATPQSSATVSQQHMMMQQKSSLYENVSIPTRTVDLNVAALDSPPPVSLMQHCLPAASAANVASTLPRQPSAGVEERLHNGGGLTYSSNTLTSASVRPAPPPLPIRRTECR